jgi:hypothetical protein
MLNLDKAWVDEQIKLVASMLGTFRMGCKLFHFEPASSFYNALASDDEEGLKSAAAQIASHLELPVVPPVDFDWGIKMEPQHAGQVRFDRPGAPIRIPFQYAGRGYVLGAILAHELCHVFMAVRQICPSSAEEDEPLTDLMTVCAGLGKLSLNGTIPESNGNPTMRFQLGYLPHDLFLYTYSQVNKLKKIAKGSAQRHLRPEIPI